VLLQVLYGRFPGTAGTGRARFGVLAQRRGADPASFAIVLPLALLVSLLYALGKLHRAKRTHGHARGRRRVRANDGAHLGRRRALLRADLVAQYHGRALVDRAQK